MPSNSICTPAAVRGQAALRRAAGDGGGVPSRPGGQALERAAQPAPYCPKDWTLGPTQQHHTLVRTYRHARTHVHTNRHRSTKGGGVGSSPWKTKRAGKSLIASTPCSCVVQGGWWRRGRGMGTPTGEVERGASQTFSPHQAVHCIAQPYLHTVQVVALDLHQPPQPVVDL